MSTDSQREATSSIALGDELPIFDLGGGIELPLRLIPQGNFRMGGRGEYDDEEPVHTVQITRAFYLGTFPVTQEQFAVWKPDHQNGFANQPRNPAEQVTWQEASEFCKWLTKNFASELPPDYVAGLPSEAQWEYACRAGTDTEYHSGDGEAALASAGWYDGNSESSTQPVGLRQANQFGLYDMHGNVWEWCRDLWDEHAYKRRCDGVQNPEVIGSSADDAGRMFRGGCWFNSPRLCRAAYRGRWSPGFRVGDQGFRVCLFPGPSTGPAEP